MLNKTNVELNKLQTKKRMNEYADESSSACLLALLVDFAIGILCHTAILVFDLLISKIKPAYVCIKMHY